MKRYLTLFLLLIISALSYAQTPIAQQPVFGSVSMPPNLLINLSVEFPTTGSAYKATTYDKYKGFLGYFNHNRCYSYNTSGQYFEPIGSSDPVDHTCSGSFSGSYMNYVTMSAIDTFRYGLTGGARIIDTSSQTVLIRANLQDSFFNSPYYFPPFVANSSSGLNPSSVTPFSNSVVYAANCRGNVYFGTSSTGNCPSPGTNANLGTYRVAVLVCDSGEGASRNDLCQIQPAGNYKPVGEIQRNATKMRFGVTGYLIDNQPDRYGGVLRAPMKYTGAEEYTTAGAFKDNSKKEWDVNTGIFVTNPEGASEGVSGVINYINKFGNVSGYKSYDPIGELYYEGLRYLMGLQPTPAAISGITAGMKDGFPVITNWADPFQAPCQQGFTITVGDANTHRDRYLPGNTQAVYGDSLRGVDEKGLDANAQTNFVGNMEGIAGMGTVGTGSGGLGSYLLVGAAYWAHMNDIRPDPTNPGKVKQTVTSYSFDVDEATGISRQRRQLHLLAKYGSFNDKNGDKNPFKTSDVSGSTVTNNSEWEDSTNPGFSSGYFLANSPDKMVSGLRRVFANIAADPSAGAAASPSNPNVTSGDNYVFSSRFISGKWVGEVFRQTIDLNTGLLNSSDWTSNTSVKAGTSTTSPVVLASSYITSGGDNRRIYLWSGTGTNKMKDFCYSGQGVGCATSGGQGLTTSEQSKFSVASAAVSLTQEAAWDATQLAVATTENLINYLRGRKDFEIDGTSSQPLVKQLFRQREQVMGDVINSEASYVKKPVFNYEKGSGGASYLAFKNTARAAALYVGGNDGMLHSFNADNGSENWGYIPPQVMGNMWRIADTAYGNTGGHRYMVDGSPIIGDVQDGSTWKSILVGGLNAGGSGFYAMDVTDPANPKALWNFCSDSSICNVSDAGVGLSFGLPVITQVKQGGSYRWVVLLSSGYNNADGKGYLFVLDPITGSILKKISTGAGTPSNPSGFAKFTTWADDAGVNNYSLWAYGGDLLGNVWRFDLNDLDSATAMKLVSLQDQNGNPQPVTARPELGEVNGKRVIYVGTGKMLSSTDLTDTSSQSVYAIKDDNAGSTLSAPRSGGFVKQTMSDTVTSNGVPARTVLNPLPVDWTIKDGWYIDFDTGATTGERVVTDMSLDLGTLSVISNRPKTGACVAGGESWIYYFDFKSGKNISTQSSSSSYVGKKITDALATRPVVVRLPNGKVIAIVRLTNNTTVTQDVPVPSTSSIGRRIGWRELQD